MKARLRTGERGFAMVAALVSAGLVAGTLSVYTSTVTRNKSLGRAEVGSKAAVLREYIRNHFSCDATFNPSAPVGCQTNEYITANYSTGNVLTAAAGLPIPGTQFQVRARCNGNLVYFDYLSSAAASQWKDLFQGIPLTCVGSTVPIPTFSPSPTPASLALPTPTPTSTPSDTPDPSESVSPSPEVSDLPPVILIPSSSATPSPTASATPTPSNTPTCSAGPHGPITFESRFPDGSDPRDGRSVGDEFKESHGIWFRLAGRRETMPALAEVGAPRTAFLCDGCSTEADGVKPQDAGKVGRFFLTDGPVDTVTKDLVIHYDPPSKEASGHLLDIDGKEIWNIVARNSENRVVGEMTIESPSDNWRNGQATRWRVGNGRDEFSTITFSGHKKRKRGLSDVIGVAFDNFSARKICR